MNPYISFVVCARNDNYGGNFLHRMQVFIDSLLSQWDRYSLDAELVIVEWNPPQEKDRLKDALKWPKTLKSNKVRIFDVPAKVHQTIPNSDRMPIFEYIAKNVGIRRAGGDFVLVTNPDILFSAELIEYLASQKLSQKSFYRADRFDVRELIPLEYTSEQQLDFCDRHAFQVHTYRKNLSIEEYRQSHQNLPLLTMIRVFLYKQRRFLYNQITGRVDKKSDHKNIYKNLSKLHTNAAGDFMLIARQGWHEFRGFPEFATHSHIDSYACALAVAIGLKQVILKDPRIIYHQEHDRSEHAKRPLTDFDKFVDIAEPMLQNKQPEISNKDNWGFGDLEFRENYVIPK